VIGPLGTARRDNGVSGTASRALARGPDNEHEGITMAIGTNLGVVA
jgi:hypothetical protein